MLRTEVWIATALIACGVIGGLIFYGSGSASNENRENPVEEPAVDSTPFSPGNPDPNAWIDLLENQTESMPTVDLNVDQMKEGDNFLAVGNYPAALRAYGSMVAKLKGATPPWMMYRLGVASELEGDVDHAEDYYRQLVTSSDQNAATRLLGLVGLTRIWQINDRADEAIQLLSELYLRYGTNEEIPEELREQVFFQYANSLSRKFLKEQVDAGEIESFIVDLGFQWGAPDADASLLLENQTISQWSPMPQDRQVQITILQQPSPEINLIALDATTSLVLVSDFLEATANRTNLTIGLSKRAHDAIIGRSTKINVLGQPLSLVLDSILFPFGLVWFQEGTHVSVAHISELEPREVKEAQFQQLDRVFRQIELSFPNGRRRTTSLMHRANLGVMIDQKDDAVYRYQELLEEEPTGEIAAQLSFNLGMVMLDTGRFNEAIDRLFFVVDQSLNQKVQSASYAWIGKLEIEKGNAERAIYAASRGLSLALDPDSREAILMTLAKAYLLESDPFSANRVLFDYSKSLQDVDSERLAAVLGAYSRYLGTTPTEGLRNEGERLVIALANLRTEDLTDFVDELLVGRAYFEVGFTQRATEMFERATEHATQEFWKRRIAYELAVNHFRMGEYEESATTLVELSKTFRDQIGILAQIKLAEIRLKQKKAAECLLLCQQLWAHSLSKPQMAKTLTMMGKSYQQLGRPHAAAVCFSGMLPRNDEDPLMSALESEEDSSEATINLQDTPK